MSTGIVQIYGVIGTLDGQASHQDVLDQLGAQPWATDLEVHISSRGGDVYEALGIYSTLNQYKAKKVVYIDGPALSCASWIAMVGDQIFIAENGMMMLHEARLSPGASTAEDLAKTAEVARQLNAQMAGTYATRTGIPVAKIAAMMASTTWLNASEAVALGFATKIIANKAKAVAGELAAFNAWLTQSTAAEMKQQMQQARGDAMTTSNLDAVRADAVRQYATISKTAARSLNVSEADFVASAVAKFTRENRIPMPA